MAANVHLAKDRMLNRECAWLDNTQDFNIASSEHGGLIVMSLALHFFPDFGRGEWMVSVHSRYLYFPRSSRMRANGETVMV